MKLLLFVTTLLFPCACPAGISKRLECRKFCANKKMLIINRVVKNMDLLCKQKRGGNIFDKSEHSSRHVRVDYVCARIASAMGW